MSKYIRTKDGIYEIISDDYGCEIPVYCDNDFGEKYIQEEDVIKFADTIEELCDEFVFMSYGKPLIINNLDIPRKYVDNYANQTFGAIWTDKGLIYVAKMNEKGELEL